MYEQVHMFIEEELSAQALRNASTCMFDLFEDACANCGTC